MASYFTRESLRELHTQEMNAKFAQEIETVTHNIKKAVILNAKSGEKENTFEYTPSPLIMSLSPEKEILNRLQHIFLDLEIYLSAHENKKDCFVFDIRWGIE